MNSFYKTQIKRSSDPLVVRHVTVAGDQIYPSFELRIMLRHLKTLGLSDWNEQLLDRIQLTSNDLNASFISACQAKQALEHFVNDLYQSGLGCDIAAKYTCAELGSIGRCLTHCGTLGEALDITVDYYQLLGSFTDITNVLGDGVLTNRLVNVANLPSRILQFLFELTVKGLITIGEELSGRQIPIREVRFQADLTVEEIALYQQKFGCLVKGNQRFDEWDLDLSFGSYLIPTSSHNNSDLLIKDLEILEAELSSHKGLVDDIDEILSCSTGDYPDPDMIAHALGVSGRTLRRRLKELGTSYSALMNKVRCQAAIKLILQSNLTNEQIADRLGFSDSANFQHAFKKWTGKTPSFYRR
ncbi:AraC family transcriptional regulator [Litoribrevibacter albus]|uniref:AraC family transcriptional regulator n=1 Tax=Litoribrevibacter albus TaxID=1473156 RepID=A0AA37S6Y9_9GAMM|nr:AraC family transcriptional regulator [Litoribrevibacter albus]GLQ30186.1 AraC family transcriptional regulator [Litoribrevibacter albus]